MCDVSGLIFSQMIQTYRQKREEFNRICQELNSQKYVEPKFQNYEIYWKRESWGETFDYSEGKIFSGSLSTNIFLNKLELKKSSKKEAQILVIIGEKSDCGCWLIGKSKRYYFDYQH